VTRAALALAALAAAVAAPPAHADVRRVEVVAAAPAGSGGEPRRQALLEQALADAVGEVALAALAPEARAGVAGPAAAAALLPDGPPAYVLRYRVLDEAAPPPDGAGAPPAATAAGSGAGGGLRVEVHVDAGRVAGALRERGLAVLGGEPGPAAQTFRVDLQGLPSWQAYAGLRRHLLESAGALEVVPELFQAGRAVVRVRAPGGPDALAARLAAAPPEGLHVEALGVSGDILALRIAEEPPLLAPPGAEGVAPFDTPD
jgi:hypothetical protein